VKQYSQEFLDQVAAEVESGVAPASTELLKDQCVLRDEARILGGKKPQCAVEK